MKDSKPSLVLYIAASTMVVIGKVLGFELLMFIGKPMVVPAIYYFYLQTKTKNTNVLFSINLWLFFVADMIMLIYGKAAILWIMGCGILSYAILIRFAFEDIPKAKFSLLNMIFLSILLSLLGYILFTILNLNIEDIINNYIIYLTYGIILIILVAISVFNYLSYSTTSFLHLCSMALCMLVSDLFYAIHRFVIALPVLDHINVFSQFLSYFLMVRYFNSRKIKVRNAKRTNG